MEYNSVAEVVAQMRMPSCQKSGVMSVSRVNADFCYFADQVEAAWKSEVRRMRNKMSDIVKQMQMAKGDTQKCEECGKAIAWDEYAVNFGWCDDCLNRHLKEDGLA